MALSNWARDSFRFDTPSIAEEPDSGCLHFVGERQPRGRSELLSLMGLDAMPNSFTYVLGPNLRGSQEPREAYPLREGAQ